MKNFILNSLEIENLTQDAIKKLACKREDIEIYQGEIRCPSYGYPIKGVFSAQAFCVRTILAFRIKGCKTGIKYLNTVWNEWEGSFPLSKEFFR